MKLTLVRNPETGMDEVWLQPPGDPHQFKAFVLAAAKGRRRACGLAFDQLLELVQALEPLERGKTIPLTQGDRL